MVRRQEVVAFTPLSWGANSHTAIRDRLSCQPHPPRLMYQRDRSESVEGADTVVPRSEIGVGSANRSPFRVVPDTLWTPCIAHNSFSISGLRLEEAGSWGNDPIREILRIFPPGGSRVLTRMRILCLIGILQKLGKRSDQGRLLVIGGPAGFGTSVGFRLAEARFFPVIRFGRLILQRSKCNMSGGGNERFVFSIRRTAARFFLRVWKNLQIVSYSVKF